MPGFAIGRYIVHVGLIAVLAAFMTLVVNDNIVVMTFNALVTSGLVSDVALQTMKVLQYGILAYAVVALVFASVGEILVANARAETNSPLIVSSPVGSFVCAFMLSIAMILNLTITIAMDALVISAGTPFVGMMIGTPFEPIVQACNNLFASAHLLCIGCAALGFLYMIFVSVQRESLAWALHNGGGY